MKELLRVPRPLGWAIFVAMMVAAVSLVSAETKKPSGDVFSVPIGDGRPVMIDGVFRGSEWEDALSLPIDDRSRLLLKRFRGTLYVGIEMPDLEAPVFDLYIATDANTVYQFHVSAQLGERRLNMESMEAQDPDIDWGKVDRWMANQMRWNENKLQQIMAAEGLSRMQVFPRVAAECQGAEFQFLEEKFAGPELAIRLEVKSAPDYKAPRIYPPATEAKKVDGWWTIKL